MFPRGSFAKAVWADYDHDYDLDLLAFGEKNVLFRNNGTSGFSDESASFPFAAGKPTDAAVFDVIPDTDGVDIVASYADHAGVVYRVGFVVADIDLVKFVQLKRIIL